jgi:NAD(P)-dependent dehydrogenase (short-subunit alcohol dehydrogenase family)
LRQLSPHERRRGYSPGSTRHDLPSLVRANGWSGAKPLRWLCNRYIAKNGLEVVEEQAPKIKEFLDVDMKFTEKVALITGGTSGIGLAVAKHMAEKGAKIVLASRSEEKGHKALKEVHAISPDAIFIETDVTQSNRVEHMVKETVKTFGRLDFAFNNAANIEVTASPSTHESPEESYDKLMDVCLKSVWLCMKYELAVMVNQKSGGIVNTSSMDALICSAGTAVYAAAKSGVIVLSKSIAQEYGRDGIRVNSFCPGAFMTPMLASHFEGISPEEKKALENKYKDFNALGRIGDTREAASIVAWLFSEDSSYVTGQNIIADGGICFA